jgi:predicted nucleic acid-binding protein
MVQKISITLDAEVLAFIDSKTKNRSQLINQVFAKLKKQDALVQLEQAYVEQSRDPEEIEEIELWDLVVGDEIDGD